MYFTSYFRLFKYIVSFSRYFTVCVTYQPLLVASWGNKIDEIQTDMREPPRRVCKREEILGAIGLVNLLRKACFMQGLYIERIQTIVRSRGESIFLSLAIEITLEEESVILSVKERFPSAGNGPPLRCNKCNKLGHTANKCSSSDRFPVANVKAVLSCFNCCRECHIAKDCRRRPTYKGGVGRDSTEAVSVETPIIQVEPRARAGFGRETTEGSRRATRQLPAGTSKWLSTVQN